MSYSNLEGFLKSSDIPKEAFYKTADGGVSVNIKVKHRKEKSPKGYTEYVTVDWQDEKGEWKTTVIGNLKEVWHETLEDKKEREEREKKGRGKREESSSSEPAGGSDLPF